MLAPVGWAWLATLVAIVWRLVYAGVFYAPPAFGKWVAKRVGLARTNLKGIPWAALWTVVGVVAFNALWSWTGARGPAEGLLVGALVGVGFAAMAAMVQPVFEGRPASVMWLYGAHHAVGWLGVGLVFGLLA